MKLHPLEDRIVVRPGESEETTASGPRHPRHRQREAPAGRGDSPSAPAVGPRTPASSSPSTSSAGDTVVYSKYGGTEITVDGEDLLILSSRDVLAKSLKK